MNPIVKIFWVMFFLIFILSILFLIIEIINQSNDLRDSNYSEKVCHQYFDTTTANAIPGKCLKYFTK